jgi:AraC-like DNA-binding protein
VKILTPDQRRDMYRRYAIGHKVDDLVKEFGVSRRYFYRHLKRKRGQPSRKVSKGVLNEVATLNYRGYSDRQIAEQLGLAQGTVSRYRRDMKLPEIQKVKRNKDNG